jgi:hypothetical protein
MTMVHSMSLFNFVQGRNMLIEISEWRSGKLESSGKKRETELHFVRESLTNLQPFTNG